MRTAGFDPILWLDQFAATPVGHALHWAWGVATQVLLAAALLAVQGTFVVILVRMAMARNGDGKMGGP